ncbi:hypothetical protein [Intestinibacter sp.]|uniref:hypothetical protein n=1 Tax=Intestinibacter sp. TaxID=1965304 RepID=UPI003F186500
MKRDRNKLKLIKRVKQFYPFDYGYLLDIEIEALKQMAEYQESKGICVNSKRYAEQMRIAIKILKIALDGNIQHDKEYKQWWMPVYVNIRNYRRFFPKDIPNIDKPIVKCGVREEKAWHLYCKIREYFMRTWWD